MNEIVVYTAIFGEYDQLRPAAFNGVRHVCFTDKPQGAEGWEEIKVERQLFNPKRESAMYLALAHRWLSNIEVSIYHGGNGQLKIDPYEIAIALGDADIAAMKHPCRDCVYDEGAIVMEHKNVNLFRARNQMALYRREGYPPHNGLAASAILVRRHTEAVGRFNDLVWSLVCKYTPRDQLAIDYAIWKTGIVWQPLSGGQDGSGYVGVNRWVDINRH
jgi:hypothetical protein